MYFLEFNEGVIQRLQELLPSLPNVSKNLHSAHHFLRIASEPGQTRGEDQKTRINASLQLKGDDFEMALQRYRTTDTAIANIDRRIDAIRNFFEIGHELF